MGSFTDPDMRPLMIELTGYHKSAHLKQLLHAAADFPSEFSILGKTDLIARMLDSMPTGYTAVLFKSTYQLHWETLTRVLHIPTFDREFSEVLRAKESGNTRLLPEAKEYVVPQGLATLALSARLIRRHVAVDQEMGLETEIAKCTDLIQRWLDTLKGKELITIQILQIQILLLLIHQNNLARPSDLWRESGNLVRSAMIMGLHRDPENSKDFSVFQKEQRRKLWMTIMELDVQFSLAAGMPTAVRSSDFKTLQMRNVDDIQLAEEMSDYPQDQDIRQWTDATSQIALGASLKERIDIVNILGGEIDLERDAASLLVQAATLERYLVLLPTPMNSQPESGRLDDKSSSKLFAKIMLDVYIRRPSLALYGAVTLSSISSRYPEARKAAVQSSIVILSHLDALDPTVADLNTIKDRDLLNLFHALCKKDIIHAALMLCVEIRRFTTSVMELEMISEIARDEVPWTKHSLTRIVENTLNSLIQHIGEFGSDLKDILALSVTLQSVRSNGSPEDKRTMMRKGTERVVLACRAICPGPLSASVVQSKRQESISTNENGVCCALFPYI
jgi:hypothetical protein